MVNFAHVSVTLAAAWLAIFPAAAQSIEAPVSPAARSEASDDARHQRAREIIRDMLTPQSVAAMENPVPAGQFGGEFAKLAFENAYVTLWTRPGLNLKERSILTIGILIGTGNEKELTSHFAAGLRNGLTREQLEEIIYHATAYAGFPAASSAMSIASKVVDQQPRK